MSMEKKEKKLRLVGLNNDAQWEILKKYIKDVFKEDIPDKDLDLDKYIIYLAGTRLNYENFVYSLAPQKLLKLFSLCMKRLSLAILPSKNGKDIDFVALEECDIDTINQYFIIQAQQRAIAQRRASASIEVVKVSPVTSTSIPTSIPTSTSTSISTIDPIGEQEAFGLTNDISEVEVEDTDSFNNFKSENF
jgi:hypothetical protein